MQYGLAFNYALSRTGGFGNLLMMTICNFIPIVGPIVLLGYRSEVAVALLDDEYRRRHPKFEFNLFSEYLTRGIYPFVIGLIIGFGGSFLAAVPLVCGMILMAAELGVLVMIFGYLAVLIAIGMLSAPMQFHAELAGKLDLGASFQFAKSFWATVGFQAVLAWIIFSILSTFVIFAGMLLFIVGIYPAISLVQMAGQHIMIQLYDEYLDRGGKAVRVKHPDDDEEDEEDRPRRRKRRDEEYDDDEDDRY